MIKLGEHNGKTVGFDLDVLLATRLLIQASSGAGKSWAIRRIVEQAFSHVQIILIDPEGEFSTLREKYDFILAGKGGDVPTDVRSAELLAHKILELKVSIVCDISEMKPFERHAWVRGFLEGLIESPKNLWHPVLVIVDEAHVYAPEKGSGESQAAESMISLASRGRKRGFCAVFATQRLSKLRKDAAAELTNVMVGRTFQDVDRKRASDVLGVLRGDERAFFDELMVLKNGQFFCLGRAISMERVLVNVGGVDTKHKSGTDFSTAIEPPPPTEKVKRILSQLAELPKEAEKKAKTIADLEGEVRSLRGQLSASDRRVRELDDAVNRLNATLDKDRDLYTRRGYETGYREGWMKALEPYKEIQAALLNMQPMPPMVIPNSGNDTLHLSEIGEWPTNTPSLRVIPPSMTVVSTPTGNKGFFAKAYEQQRNGDKLRAGAERMLAALCQWYPESMSFGQMRSHAGMKKSGTFSTYLSDLRRSGYIEENGDTLRATSAGLAYFGTNIPKAPSTTEEVLAIWNPKLRDGARRMLQALVDAKGRPMNHDFLAQSVGMTRSGTYSTYLSDLRRARLIETSGGSVSANKETLFL